MSQPFATSETASLRRPLIANPTVISLTLAGAFLAGAALMPPGAIRLIAFSAGIAMITFAVVWPVLHPSAGTLRSALLRQIETVAGGDGSPCFVTDKDGEIRWRNKAAAERFDDPQPDTLSQAFRSVFANPAAVLFRLQNRAQAIGSAREDVTTRRGQIRLCTHQTDADTFLWRLEDFGEKSANTRGAEGMSLPMLTASKSGTVLFMNEAMRRVLGGRVKTLDRVFNEMPVRPGEMNVIATLDGPVPSLVAEVEGAGGRRELYLIPGIDAQAGSDSPVSAPAPPQPFDQLPVPLLKIKSGGQISEANQLARKLLAMPKTGNFSVSDLIEGLGRSVRDWLDDALDGRALGRSEIVRARLPEDERFLQITLTRRAEAGGHVLIAVLTDATELNPDYSLEPRFLVGSRSVTI